MRRERGSGGVVFARQLPFDEQRSEGAGMRIIGLDIHRAFAEAVAWENGKLKRLGRVDMRRDLLGAFAATLSKDDVVVVEATGNAAAVASVITPHVKRGVIATPNRCASSPLRRSRPTPSTPAR